MSMRLVIVASMLLLSALSCQAGTRELWTGPRILVQPGSSVVVVRTTKHRQVAVHSPPGELFAHPVDSVQTTTLETAYQTLDVRSCRAGPVHHYPGSVEEFGWGTAPGELWLRRSDDAAGLEPLGGGGQIPFGRHEPIEVWGKLPFVSVGVVKVRGFLRVLDFPRRSARDIPLVPDVPVDTILPVRPGDQNLVGLARGKDLGSLDAMVVPLEAGAWGAPMTTRFEERPSGVQLVHGGAWLALPPNDWPGQSPPPKEPLALLVADVRTGEILRRVEHEPMHDWALVEASRLWFAHSVGGPCRRLEVMDVEAGTRAELPLPGCVTAIEPWRSGEPFLTIGFDYQGPSTQLVDLRSGRVAPLPGGTPDQSAVVGNIYFTIDGSQDVSALDLVTGQGRRAVTSAGRVGSISSVPFARQIVLVNEQRSILVYDIDAGRLSKCL